jgi:hypothetical protein
VFHPNCRKKFEAEVSLSRFNGRAPVMQIVAEKHTRVRFPPQLCNYDAISTPQDSTYSMRTWNDMKK